MTVLHGDGYTLYHGDCLDILPTLAAGSVDAVVTDPPYPRVYIPLYGDLSRLSAHVLRDGGLLAVMCGQTYLPQVLNLMTPHLEYRWTMAYTMLGGQAPQIWPRRVISFWKPVFVFSKGPHGSKWFGDVAKSAGNDKRFHKWGQSVSGMVDLITRLTNEGDLVLDPFAGSGTTGMAALREGFHFIGIEQEADYCEIARRRMEYALSQRPAARQPSLLAVGD